MRAQAGGGEARSVLGGAGSEVATPRQPVVVSVPEPEARAVNMEAQAAHLDAMMALTGPQFYPSNAHRDEVIGKRRAYPRKVATKKPPTGPLAMNADLASSELPPVQRAQGFGLGVEKLFASTSVKLPVSAYPLYVEMSGPHGELWQRLFRGTSTIADLKIWIMEKLVLPDFSYELSYAELGKSNLADDLRLLTTDESLESRTLATIRAAQPAFQGIPGVHSTSSVSTTNLYVRLKCMHSGDVLSSLAPSRKFKTFMTPADMAVDDEVNTSSSSKIVGVAPKTTDIVVADGTSPLSDPLLEGCWVRPDEDKHSYYHSRGFELFKAARDLGNKYGHSCLAKISINNRNYPSRIEKPLKGVSGGEPLKASF